MRSQTLRLVGGVSGGNPPGQTMIGGEGFSATRTTTGTYQIRFAKPFRRTPAVTVAPQVAAASGQSLSTQIGAIAADGFTVYVVANNVLADTIGFTFSAVGGE